MTNDEQKITLNSLEDYLAFYKQFGFGEQTIVKLYISEKNLELEYSDMILELVKSALYKEQYKMSMVQEVIRGYNNYCGAVHNPNWTQEENTMWDQWLIEYALFFKLSEKTQEVVKERVPEMELPFFGYRGLLAYINKECGILFKNQKEADDFELLEEPKYNFTTRWY